MMTEHYIPIFGPSTEAMEYRSSKSEDVISPCTEDQGQGNWTECKVASHGPRIEDRSMYQINAIIFEMVVG